MKSVVQMKISFLVMASGSLVMVAGIGGARATEVAVVTPLGEIRVELYEDKPVTVGNFLAYLNGGRYENSFSHRLVPGFAFQGGGFYLNGNSVTSVPTYSPIVNEYGVGQIRSNSYGTLAMARQGGVVNSATSQWFFNLNNNSGLDAVDGGFTVFGHVVAGLDVLSLYNTTFNQGSTGGRAVYNATAQLGSAFGELPLLAGSLSTTNLISTTWSVITSTAYWKGGTSGQWSQSANFGTSQSANYTFTSPLSATADVVFNASGAANFSNTTLGVNQTIRSLTLGATSSVGIGGAQTLTITPGASAVGITVPTGAPGAITHSITSQIALGGAQTWTIADADRTLVVGGNVSGDFGLTKAGDGVLTLNGTQAYASLIATDGTTNVNGALVRPVGTTSVVVSAGAKLKFGSVSQKLGSLTIGSGGVVSFSSGSATGGFSGIEKGGEWSEVAVVPEPSVFGLLVLGAGGLLRRRRRGG